MVSLEKDHRTQFKSSWDLMGLSSDEKPVEIDGKPVPNGSSFLEMDTQMVAFFDADSQTWLSL